MDALASLVDRGSHSSYTAVPHSSDLAKQKAGTEMLYAWIGLQLAGQVTLPILILTMLFHKSITKRNPTVINLCIVWTLATIPPELLFYTGQAEGRARIPSPMLCLFQAATTSAVPPMVATAYLAVVVHASTVVYDIIHANTLQPISLNVRVIFLLSSPYILFLTFALVVAIVGAQNAKDVQRTLFFCEVKNHHLSLPVFGFTLIVVLVTLILQIWIAVVFYRHWRAKRRGNIPHRDMSSFDFGLLSRTVAFTVFEVVIIIASVGTMMNPKLGAAKILLATPPFAVFLIFATSPDILRAWFPCCFRRKPKRSLAEQASETPVTTTSEDGNDRVPSPFDPVMIPAEYQAQHMDLERGDMTVRADSFVSIYPASYSGPASPTPGTRTVRSPTGPRPMRSTDVSI